MGSVRVSLSIMMFLQYAIWGAWAVWMGGYMGKTLGFSGAQISTIYSTTPIAAMISPLFMGVLADRFMATERVIALLHLIGAGLLVWGGFTSDFNLLFWIMLMYGIVYMPTLALTNSISFANIGNAEQDFPWIRVWGTMGWIVVGVLVGFVFDPEGGVSRSPMFLAAGCSAALGLFAFMLPHTPPKTKEQRAAQKAGNRVGVISMLADPSFLVFVVCSFLICIPLSLYYALANLYLVQLDAPAPTSLQAIGQASEVLFMAAMPFFIAKLGVKRMLLIGMLAWAIRYFAFMTLSFPMIVVGLLLHGICYDFFFVASQVYVDNRASEDQRASAQSFIAFVTLGLGMYVGTEWVGGYISNKFPAAAVAVTAVDKDGTKSETTKPLPAWDPKGETGFAKTLSLTKDSEIVIVDLPEQLIDEAKDGSKTIYGKTDLSSFLANKLRDDNMDGKISRSEWRVGRRNQWGDIWFWPAVGAIVTCLLFWVGFKDQAAGSTKEEDEPKDELES